MLKLMMLLPLILGSIASIAKPNCSGWGVEFGGTCYVGLNQDASWRSGEDACNLIGGSLASVHSPEENELVRSITQYSESYWTWLGMYVDHGDPAWSDGSQNNYFNWENDDSYLYNNECGLLRASDGSWEAADCNAVAASIVCKRWPITTTITTTTTINPAIFDCQGFTRLDCQYADTIVETLEPDAMHCQELCRRLIRIRCKFFRYTFGTCKLFQDFPTCQGVGGPPQPLLEWCEVNNKDCQDFWLTDYNLGEESVIGAYNSIANQYECQILCSNYKLEDCKHWEHFEDSQICVIYRRNPEENGTSVEGPSKPGVDVCMPSFH